jgi:hypothetical protein
MPAGLSILIAIPVITVAIAMVTIAIAIIPIAVVAIAVPMRAIAVPGTAVRVAAPATSSPTPTTPAPATGKTPAEPPPQPNAEVQVVIIWIIAVWIIRSTEVIIDWLGGSQNHGITRVRGSGSNLLCLCWRCWSRLSLSHCRRVGRGQFCCRRARL